MSPPTDPFQRMAPAPWIALGLGAATAGAAATVSALTWARRNRDPQIEADLAALQIAPSDTAATIASDGVPLAVAIDEPGPDHHDRAHSAADSDQTSARPTVVLSHGFTHDARLWVHQRRALQAAGYRVISWDQRGHGRSGVGEPDSYTIDQLGADLAAVIAAHTRPDEELALVGHSMGGMAVMAWAAEHRTELQTRVTAVGLVSTSATGSRQMTWGMGPLVGGALTRWAPTALAPLRHRQEWVDAVLRGSRDVSEWVVGHAAFGSPVSAATTRLTAQMILGTRLDVMSGYIPGLASHDKTAALSALSHVPTLVMTGDRDILTGPAHSERIAAAVDGARLVVVPRAGHVLPLEHPETLNRALLDLLGEGSASAAADTPKTAREAR